MPPALPAASAVPSLSRALVSRPGTAETERLVRFRSLPWGEALQFLATAAEDGLDEDEAIAAAAWLFDASLAFDVAVPGPGGVLLEAVDGPLIRAGLKLAWGVVKRRKARAARKETRAARREARDA